MNCPILNCTNQGNPLCLSHYARVPVGMQAGLLKARNTLQRAQNAAQLRIRSAAYRKALSAAIAAVQSKETSSAC